MRLSHIFEPEETVGTLWHRIVDAADNAAHFPEASFPLERLRDRLGVFFRGLGGEHGIELKAIGVQDSNHRLTWRERLGTDQVYLPRARIDGDHLFLPVELDALPSRALNRDLYFWLTAWAVAADGQYPEPAGDSLQRDIAFLRFARQVTQRALFRFPGLRGRYEKLRAAFLETRPSRRLPDMESRMEAAIRAVLGDVQATGHDDELQLAITDTAAPLDDWHAPRKYRPFKPVLLWALPEPRMIGGLGQRHPDEGMKEASASGDTDSEKTYRAKRREADQVERKDSLILNRFEAILSWAEMGNLNRKVEDEDEENARKAADDMDEISLVSISKKASTKLKFDLDLAPEDAERERLSGVDLYPEWDYRTGLYLKDQCRVLSTVAEAAEPGREWQPDKAATRRIKAVRRQFEALRPKRETLHRQLDGAEFDMDALIRARCDLAARREGSDRIYMHAREQTRDLAIAVLIDVSRSSESWVEGRQVIEIARETLAALTLGLSACGDDHALFAFSSLRRDRVFLSTVKDFEEAAGPLVMSRIGALKPGFYTRLGTAVRHVSKMLAERPNARKMVLVITDGKPNDLDHYEGRYGIEDTRMAILEARRKGQAVFGVTIDSKAQVYFPHIFGRNAYAIASHADKLTQALPLLYRHLVK